jgi:BMFP domain-containing protein YqiC
MAKASQKDILARVQDLGEEALQRLSEVPGGSRLVEMATQTRNRLDDLQRRVLGLEDLEQRVAKLEQQLAAQTPSAASAASGTTATARAKKTSTARKPSTPKKPPA